MHNDRTQLFLLHFSLSNYLCCCSFMDECTAWQLRLCLVQCILRLCSAQIYVLCKLWPAWYCSAWNEHVQAMQTFPKPRLQSWMTTLHCSYQEACNSLNVGPEQHNCIVSVSGPQVRKSPQHTVHNLSTRAEFERCEYSWSFLLDSQCVTGQPGEAMY